MLLTGASRTGKTHFTKALLRKATEFITPQIDLVFWFAPSRQNDLFDELESYEIGKSLTFVIRPTIGGSNRFCARKRGRRKKAAHFRRFNGGGESTYR